MDSKTEQRILSRAVVVAAAAGIICTLGVLYFLSASPIGEKIRGRFGLDNLQALNLTTTRSQKIVVEESSAIIDAAKKIRPSVVSITGKGQQTTSYFGFQSLTPTEVAGTGFVVTADGLIVTNKHVVENASSFTVTTNDGKTFSATVVATDPSNDIAFMKVEGSGLPVVEFGDYDKLQVGQWVIAIGNALGELQNSVTVGVISAKERSVDTDSETLYGLLQTDVAINPGNSGGPLVNLAGQVVGVNTAIAGNAQGIGFAIAATDITKDLDSYQKNGKILQPYLGINYRSLTKNIATTLGLSVDHGAYIVSNGVVSGSPAAVAGLRPGDVVTMINDDEVTDTNPLVRLVRKHSPGDKIIITYIRDGNSQTTDLILGTTGN